MSKYKTIIVILLLLSFAVLIIGAVGTQESYERIDPMVIEVTENFINIFWDSKNNYFYRNNTGMPDFVRFSGPLLGKYTDFWLEAQHWETVMDIYERQGGDFYRDMIDKVYIGFKRYYTNYKTNGYNDDIGWWAMGCTRAYAITQNKSYLNDAKEMFDYIYNNWSQDLGGGIFWNTDRQDKNMCTNAPAAATAARLGVLLQDKSYIDKAYSLFEWLKGNLYEEESGKVSDTKKMGGDIIDWQFSYNYGTFALAAYELYLAAGEENYLNYVTKPLDYFLQTKAADGILPSEGDGDGAAFRTIYLRTLNKVKHLNPSYQEVINQNALATYRNRRSSDNLNGHDWTIPPSEDEIIISSLVAASVSLMQFYIV